MDRQPDQKTRARKSPPLARAAEATKAALLAAGEKLFAQDGFKGVTVDMLAAASGTNRALISYHFGSKAGLYDAVIGKLANAVASEVRMANGQGPDPARAMSLYIRHLATAFAGV